MGNIPDDQLSVPTVEMLEPQVVDTNSMQIAFVATPNLGGIVSDLRGKLMDALSIPGDRWPSNRRVTMKVEIALVPLGISAVIENIDD